MLTYDNFEEQKLKTKKKIKEYFRVPIDPIVYEHMGRKMPMGRKVKERRYVSLSKSFVCGQILKIFVTNFCRQSSKFTYR